MLSQEWVSKSVDLKGLNGMWKIACSPTDPVATISAAICHPRGLELSARNGGPSPNGGVWLYQNHTLDECRELAEMKRYELKRLVAPLKRPRCDFYKDSEPSQPFQREPLSTGVKRALAIRSGEILRYFAYRTTPNPEIDPDFPAELRREYSEQSCYENSAGIGVNDESFHESDMAMDVDGVAAAVPDQSPGTICDARGVVNSPHSG